MSHLLQAIRDSVDRLDAAEKARNDWIAAAYYAPDRDWTVQQIADAARLTRERVHQIVKPLHAVQTAPRVSGEGEHGNLTPRQTERANAAMRRFEAGLHTLDGCCLGLAGVAPAQFFGIDTPEQHAEWHRILNEAVSNLGRCRSAITEAHHA